MVTFPRTVLPVTSSDLWSPGALKSLSNAGLMQIRNTKQVGWSWTDQWGILNVRNTDDNTLRSFVKKAWNRGEIYDILHPQVPGSGIAPNGLGTGTVIIKGAAQVGDVLIVDGFPINTPNCVRAEDALKFVADNAVYIVTADAGSDALGEVSIPLSPPLRLSPADNSAVCRTYLPA